MKTYTMFVRTADEDPPSFEPVMCMDDLDAIRKARALLGERAGATSIEVYFGDEHIFAIGLAE